MKVNTAQFRYSAEDRIDITVKTGLSAFAPTWEMVKGYKSGAISEIQYTNMYLDLMRESYMYKPNVWGNLLSMESVTLVCYCATGQFCHRHLLMSYLVQLGAIKGDVS